MKALRHLRTIIVHRYWVRHYCFKAGLYWQGLTHDLSKYSPTEFLESIRYYQGNHSPIEAAKADKGYSYAWLHHRGRNKHHWVYWVDELEKGMIPIQMPLKYATEMFCDFLGAGRAYMGKSFTIEAEAEWWARKRLSFILHPATRKFIDLCFKYACRRGIDWVLKNNIPYSIYLDATNTVQS